MHRYWQQTLDDLPTTSKYTATSTAACMFANRMSYFFNLVCVSLSNIDRPWLIVVPEWS